MAKRKISGNAALQVPPVIRAMHSKGGRKPNVQEIDDVSYLRNGTLRICATVGGFTKKNKIEIDIPFEMVANNFKEMLKFYLKNIKK